MAKTYCPKCDSEITMTDPQYDTLFKCPDCDVDLEVIDTNPFEVDFPLDYWHKDWDDEREDQ